MSYMLLDFNGQVKNYERISRWFTVLTARHFAETTEKDFGRHSFIEWDFQDRYYAQLDKAGSHRTQLQLMFRTRQQDTGLLWKAQNAQKSEYLTLEVRLALGFNPNDQMMPCTCRSFYRAVSHVLVFGFSLGFVTCRDNGVKATAI
jgi:hypothetical protein